MAGSGVWVGVDVGSARIGLAASDPGGVLAVPVRTVAVGADPAAALDEVAALCADLDAEVVVVGLPRNLSGIDGPASDAAREAAAALGERMPHRRVVLVDERLTTVAAHRRLRESGVSGRERRQVVDQAAAVLILQGALDHRAATGEPGGEQLAAPSGRRKPRTKDRR